MPVREGEDDPVRCGTERPGQGADGLINLDLVVDRFRVGVPLPLPIQRLDGEREFGQLGADQLVAPIATPDRDGDPGSPETRDGEFAVQTLDPTCPAPGGRLTP